MKKLIASFAAMIILSTLLSTTTLAQTKKQTYQVTIDVKHEKVFWEGAAYNVMVDKKKIAKLKPGQEKISKLKLTKGKHVFYIKNNGVYKTKKITFTVSSSHKYFHFHFKTRSTLGIKVWKD